MVWSMVMAVSPARLGDRELGAVRRLVVGSMLARRFALPDAEDVAQDVLMKIAAEPERFAEQVGDIDRHAPYFVRMALNACLMRLRSERRRARRETTWSRLVGPAAADDAGGHEPNDVLVLAEAAPLSSLQREYLWAVLDEHRSIEEIAHATRTTPRAVRAVLQRATAILREQYEASI